MFYASVLADQKIRKGLRPGFFNPCTRQAQKLAAARPWGARPEGQACSEPVARLENALSLSLLDNLGKVRDAFLDCRGEI
jgi:hypothetical protein